MKIDADIYNFTPNPVTIDDGINKVTFQPMEIETFPNYPHEKLLGKTR